MQNRLPNDQTARRPTAWAVTLTVALVSVGLAVLIGLGTFNRDGAPETPRPEAIENQAKENQQPNRTLFPAGELRPLPEGYQDAPQVQRRETSDTNQDGGWWINVSPVSVASESAPGEWMIVLHRDDDATRSTRERREEEWPADSPPPPSPGGEVLRRAQGEGESHVVFRDLPAGSYNLQLRADGWVAPDLFGVEYNGEQGETTINLFQLGSIRFRFLDDSGDPVAGATARLSHEGVIPLPFRRTDSEDGYIHYQQLGFPLRLVSDDNGEAAFIELPPGKGYWLSAGHDQRANHRVNDIELRPGENKTVDVTLSAGAFLSGQVVGSDGQPVAGAEVSGYRPYEPSRDREIEVGHKGGSRSRGWIQESRGRTDADGRFTAGPFSSGVVRLRISSDSQDVISYLTMWGRERYNEWVEEHGDGEGQGLRLAVQEELQAGEHRDLGVLRPEYPPVEVILVCDGFEQPDDLIVTANPLVDRKRPESSIEEVSTHGSVWLLAGDRDRVVFENFPPCILSISVRSLSDATKPYRGSNIEGVGDEPKTVYVELEQAPRPPPTVDVHVIPDPVPDKGDFFAYALIQPDSNAFIRYAHNWREDLASWVVNAAVRKNDPLFDELEANGEYTLWMTNGDKTVVTTFDLTGRGTEGSIELRPVLRELAGACEFQIKDQNGSPVPGAEVEWYWNEEHFEASSHSPYLKAAAGDDGVATVRGYPLLGSGVIATDFVFRVSAKGFKSKSVKTVGGTAGNPGVEKVRLDPK